MKTKLFLLMGAILLSACAQPFSTAPAVTNTPIKTATGAPANATIVSVSTVGPLPTVTLPTATKTAVPATYTSAPTNTPFPTATPFVILPATALPECTGKDGTLLNKYLYKEGEFWVLDPTLLPDEFRGCDLIAEGRKELTQEHHIWVLRDDKNADLSHLDVDGKFRAREMSVYSYPNDWDMDDFNGDEYVSMASFFARDKRANQLANGYDWIIITHMTDGKTRQYAVGMTPDYILGNGETVHCMNTEPIPAVITGVIDLGNGTYTASIGGEDCYTAANVDGTWNYWQNAQDNIQFSTIEAWLIPSTWTEKQVTDWIASR